MCGWGVLCSDLSVQYALNCLPDAGTCNGGSDLSLYSALTKEGLPDETCEAYEAVDEVCNATNKCRNCFGPPGSGYCFAQPKYKVYRVADYGYLENPEGPPDPDTLVHDAVSQARTKRIADTASGKKASGAVSRILGGPATALMVQKMKNEIRARGPISCVVDAETMFEYKAGEILDKEGKEINHVISVAGWGQENDTSYWVVRNSWGTYFGDNGWMKVKMVCVYAQVCVCVLWVCICMRIWVGVQVVWSRMCAWVLMCGYFSGRE